MFKSNGAVKEKHFSPYSSDKTHIPNEISKILNVMYENNFQRKAILQSGPFAVNPLSCGDVIHLQVTFEVTHTLKKISLILCIKQILDC